MQGREPKAHGFFSWLTDGVAPFDTFQNTEGHWISLAEDLGVIMTWKSWKTPELQANVSHFDVYFSGQSAPASFMSEKPES